MLAGLGIDGRFSLTAFAPDAEAAEAMYQTTRYVVAHAAESMPPRDGDE